MQDSLQLITLLPGFEMPLKVTRHGKRLLSQLEHLKSGEALIPVSSVSRSFFVLVLQLAGRRCTRDRRMNVPVFVASP